MSGSAGASLSDPPVAGEAVAIEHIVAVPPTLESSPRVWWLMAGLVAAILVVFGQTVGFPYTNWDDPIFVFRDNPYVQTASWENVRAIFTPTKIPRETIYVPLFYFSFLVESATVGLRPVVSHSVNLALHLANALMVFHLLRRLSGSLWPAYLAALAFAIHPVQAEAVAWAMGRKDLLSTFFGLISILCYLRYQESRDRGMIAMCLLAFTAGVLSKPTLLTLPGVFVLLDYLRLPKVSARDFGNKIAFIAVCIFIYTLNSQYPANPPDLERGVLMRLACIPWMLWHWWLRLGLLESPVAVYDWPDGQGIGGILALGAVGLAVLAAVVIWAWRKRDVNMAIGLGFAALAGVPAATVVLSSRPFITADRYGYFPLIGFFFAVMIGVCSLRAAWRRGALVLVGVWLAASTVMAIPATRAWSDSRLLWERVVDRSPDSALAWQHLSIAYAEAGDTTKAERAFRRAIVLDPDDDMTRWNYRQFLLDPANNDWPRLLREFNTTLAEHPGDPMAQVGQGALAELMSTPAAEDTLLSLLDERPHYIDGWLFLAGYYQSRDRPAAAATCYQSILAIDPTHPTARRALQSLER